MASWRPVVTLAVPVRRILTCVQIETHDEVMTMAKPTSKPARPTKPMKSASTPAKTPVKRGRNTTPGTPRGPVSRGKAVGYGKAKKKGR